MDRPLPLIALSGASKVLLPNLSPCGPGQAGWPSLGRTMPGVPRPEGLAPDGHVASSPTFFKSCSVQFSSAAQSCLTLCDPMDSSTPGFPVHHQLPELKSCELLKLQLLVPTALRPHLELQPPLPTQVLLISHTRPEFFPWH